MMLRRSRQMHRLVHVGPAHRGRLLERGHRFLSPLNGQVISGTQTGRYSGNFWVGYASSSGLGTVSGA